MGLSRALPQLGPTAALQWCLCLWSHVSKWSTTLTVCSIHCCMYRARGPNRGAHRQPTETMCCGVWALSNRYFALQVLFSRVTAHRPSNAVDRAMGCNSGWGDAQQAKGVLVTQRLNRHHTGTKTLSWPGFSSAHVCGWCLHYLNPLQLSQRGSSAWVISSISPHLWRGDRTGAKQKLHGRACMNLKGGWLLFSFLFEKAFLSGHENNYPPFTSSEMCKWHT